MRVDISNPAQWATERTEAARAEGKACQVK